MLDLPAGKGCVLQLLAGERDPIISGSRTADISSFSWRFAVNKSWYGDGKS